MSSQQPRAERISEAKWNEWRTELESLYLEKEASQDDILYFLRIKHPERITAKQLKHRFQKWGLRKYISGQDMKSIISLVRQHEAHGKEITIRYKGHEVEQLRIERAMRRCRGPFSSPRSIPSYIEYQCRLPRITQIIQRENPISSIQNSVESSALGSSTAFFPRDEGAQAVNSVGTTPDVSQVSGSIGSLGEHGVDPSPGILTIPDITNADARVLSTTSPLDDHTQSMNSVNALSHQSPNTQGDILGSQSLENTGSFNSGIDWLIAGTLSLGDPSLYGGSPENTRLGHDWSGHTLPSPPRLSTDFGTNQNRGTDFNIPLINSRNDIQVVLPNGDDPEEIVTSLRLTISHLLMSFDHSMRDRNFCRGSTLHLLRHLLCGGWLLDELENLLLWSYEASARAIRQSQFARKRRLKDTFSEISDIRNDKYETLRRETNLHRRSSALSRPRTKLTSAWSSHMPNCTLNIRLRTVTPQHLIIDDKEPSSVLEMSSIPITGHHTTGVSAIFINPLAKTQGPRISPEIRTFNVVPEGSEIIKCVKNNDLQGVQSLFDLGKASPSDVDPRGFSLLSASALPCSIPPPLTLSFYAMHNGCSDIFDLLVRTGAGIQNCKRFGGQHDAIGAIWSYFITYNSNDCEEEHAPRRLGSFEECKRMTEVVLAHGCDIEDTIGFSGQANALFELCYHWPLDQAHTPTADIALDYLSNIGYELEKKNHTGQTPLLWTASSYQPQVIKCLRAFIRKGANQDAVDSSGRGVVHSALAAPHIFDSWRSLTITIHGVHVRKLYGLPHLIYSTESTAHADDYSDQVLKSNRFSEQEDASLFDREAYLFQTDHYASTQETYASADDISTTFDSALPGSTPVEDPNLEEYVPLLDPNGVENLVKNPIHVLKTRLRYKLLTLLQSSCDPNILDKAGASPSDYARRDGLWPQWSWALEKSGHIYDARNDRWVRVGRFENSQQYS